MDEVCAAASDLTSRRLWFHTGRGKKHPGLGPPPAPRHRYLPPPCSAPLPIRACRRQSHTLAVLTTAPHAPGTPAATQAAPQKVGSLVARKYERLPALEGLDNKAKITDIRFYFVLFLFFFFPCSVMQGGLILMGTLCYILPGGKGDTFKELGAKSALWAGHFWLATFSCFYERINVPGESV